jgi:hypothetical protein
MPVAKLARHRVRIDVRPGVNGVHTLDPGADPHFGKTRGKELLGHRAGRHARDSLARRRAPTPLPGANAVLGVIGEVGVARTIDVVPLVVRRGAGVPVAHQETNGSAQRASGLQIDARQELGRVVLGARGGELALPRPAARHRFLHLAHVERVTWRASVDDAAHADAMALAKCRHAESSTEAAAGHA